MVLFYGMVLNTRTKVGMIRQNYNVIDEISFRAKAKWFAHKTMQKKVNTKHHVISKTMEKKIILLS